MDLRGTLASAGIFSSSDPQDLAAVAALATTRRLRRGELLFSEGEPGDALYVVASGRVKVLRSSPRGGELLLTVLGPGDAVGELSVLDGQERSATAQALDDAVVVALAGAALRELLARRPALALAWALELATTVRRLTGSASDLVFLDLPRRLAKLLLDGGSDCVDLGLSQGEVAARLGVTRQSLNRTLSALQHRRWVQVDGTRVHVLDRTALQRFATS